MHWLLSLLLTVAHAKVTHHKRSNHHRTHTIKMAESYLKKIGSCKTQNPTQMVLIIKQWHLAPQIITKGFRDRYPQQRNQTAIYKALAEEIRHRKLQLVVSEGCEGEIDSHFKPKFNGWDYASLKRISWTKHYPYILTLVPLKLEARFDKQVLTMCGDNLKLIRESEMHLSNLRGWGDYWSALTQFKNEPDKLKPYLDSAIHTLKISKSSSLDQVLGAIKDRFKIELNAFTQSLYDRNASFVKMLQAHEFKRAAVVIGGLHAEDLQTKLEKAGFGCEVLEPPGYADKDEQLIRQFEQALK